MFGKQKWAALLMASVLLVTGFAGMNLSFASATEATGTAGVPLDPTDTCDLVFLWPLAHAPLLEGSKIGEAIREATGINLTIIPTMGDWQEYHTLMLASGDFPDVVTVNKGTSELPRYVESESLIDVEELAKIYAPTFLSVLESDENGNLANIYRDMGDGVLRFWGMDFDVNAPGQSPVIDYYGDQFFSIKDFPSFSMMANFPQIGEFTDAKPKNLDDVYALYTAYMEAYGGDGVHYAVTLSRDSGKSLVEMANSMAGYQTVDHAISKRPEESYADAKFYFMEPSVLPFMQYLNKLYREGIMDPEGPIQTQEDAIAKLSSGYVFSTLGGWYEGYQASQTFIGIEGKEDNMFVAMILSNDGEQYWNANTASLGWRVVGITPSCKRPDKVLQLIEWLYTSQEAQLLLGYGFEGEDYIWNEQGEPDINAEIDSTHNGDYYFELGFSNGDTVPWNWAFWPALSRTKDGYPPDVTESDYRMNPDSSMDPAIAAVAASPFNFFYDTTGTYFAEYGYMGITLGSDDMRSLAKGTADNLINDAVANMVMAGSEAEVEQIYNETVQLMIDAGILEYMDYMNGIATERANME